MTTQSDIEQRLLEFLHREVLRGRPDLTLDTDLVAAGFDSMSLVSLLLFVEREYGIWIPERQMTVEVLKNTRSLASHVLKQLT